MKNYTLIINRVLTEWLKKKEWDVRNIYVGDNEPPEDAGMVYFVSYESYAPNIYFHNIEFTQSELDAVKSQYQTYTGYYERQALRDYIRAKLEKESE